MTELVPLLRGEADELEMQLLSSARQDAPSPEARARTLAALGVGGAIVTTAAVTAGSGAAGGGAATAGSATAKLGLAVVVKWVGIGLLAGTVTSVGATAVTSAPGRAVVVEDTEAPAAPAALPAVRAPKVAFAATAEPERARAEEPAAVASASAAPEAAPEPDVAAEVALLDRARGAMARGDSAGAIAALRKHDAEFKNGTLNPEADVLRIEALLGRGDSARAAGAARAFLASHGESPLVGRVRKLLQKAQAAEKPAPVPMKAAASPAPAPEPVAPEPAPAAPATASFPVQ
ncbi:MAG: hypothetical protein KC776_11120 [Myxococcales bacterium]|nr:hypothetical protein [Myxococcales bacterium]